MFLKSIRSILVIAAALVVPTVSMAQAASDTAYPTRPLRLIVGFAAGSSADALARLYAQKLSEVLGQTVYVENKPGAGQINAIRTLQMSPADGHTIYLATGSSLSQGPGIRKDLPYDPLKAFSFIGHLGTAGGMIYVHPDVPVRTVGELITYSKENPNKLSYGTAGVGSAGHLGAEFFMNLTGAKLFHVPFKSDPEAAREVAAGTVQVAFTLGRAMAPLAEANKVRPLMAINAKRLSFLPNVPSASETGVKDLESIGPFTYYGLVGPTGLPAPIIDKLNRAINQISAQPDLVTQLQNYFIDPMPATPHQFQSFVEKEIAKWRKVGNNVKIEF
ncbi:tripartite tricarboxylate transporter substrate-binding protein [Ramlibacter sp. 2FC]|uniref:Bug family tripartite tricarboxylate transporter substrate binding protein n=1 Tax=Ramlibacter sp. 2FC TaxID=2502188 RepID=UPI0010F7542F|nr:tripartite tricarboxylate transporter substrate-binding protein [Ramlibacter sp. 2FC]